MKAVLVKTFADVRRRRLQTGLVALITLLAAAMATTSLTLLVRSTAPFDDVFQAANGAHLMFHVQQDKVSLAALRATATLPGVTAAGEPHPITVVPIEVRNEKTAVELVGRDDPGGAIDRVQLVAGRWVQTPGEVVVTRSAAEAGFPINVGVGDTLYVLSRPDRPSLRVVGVAVNVSDFGVGGAAWVRADQISALAGTSEPKLGYEMGYRVKDGDTEAGLQAATKAIQATLPADSQFARTTDWISHKKGMTWMVTLLSSALLAFTTFALIAAALIVANAVTGAVVASRREIGIMKAVGFAPREVVLVFVGQMLAAGALGASVGVAVGVAISQPLLAHSADAMGLPAPSPVYLAADLGVLLATLLVVGVAALVPALRAGSTNAVAALALGAAPPATGGAWLGRAVQRLGLPRSMSVGVDDAFRRPFRGVLTVFALLIGLSTLTTAIAFRATAEGAATNTGAMGTNYDFRVDRFGAYPDSSVTTTITSQPEVTGLLAEKWTTIRLSQLTDPVHAVAVRGGLTGFGYHATSGRWFQRPGEAVVAPVTMKEAHLNLGDTFHATVEGHPVQLTVVGTMNDWTVYDGRGVRFDWVTYASVTPDAQASDYLVRVRPGTDTRALAARVQRSAPHFLQATAIDQRTKDSSTLAFEWIMAAPALLLIVIAAVGVFNTMLLNSRERSYDVAVLKTVGMSGRQVMAMVLAPAVVLALIALVIGLPVGLKLHDAVVSSMAQSIGATFDSATLQSLGWPGVLAVVLGGVATAVIGSVLPAWWAAKAPVALVLRAE